MSDTVKTRSFSVPPGRQWTCLPLDGDGPVYAREGDTVLIIVERSWEKAVRAAQQAMLGAAPKETK